LGVAGMYPLGVLLKCLIIKELKYLYFHALSQVFILGGLGTGFVVWVVTPFLVGGEGMLFGPDGLMYGSFLGSQRRQSRDSSREECGMEKSGRSQGERTQLYTMISVRDDTGNVKWKIGFFQEPALRERCLTSW